MTDAKPTNVVAALARVMDELPAIAKDQKSPQGYQYRGIEQITKEAQGLFAKYGVIFAPSVEMFEQRELIVNGKPWTDQRLLVHYRIYGPGGIEDFIDVTVPGIGRDNSDKGANKAMSQALKYALLQVLCISDAKDDTDSEPVHEATHVSPSAPAPAEQRASQAGAVSAAPATSSDPAGEKEAELFALVDQLGALDATKESCEKHRAQWSDDRSKYLDWLDRCIKAAEANLREKPDNDSPFAAKAAEAQAKRTAA